MLKVAHLIQHIPIHCYPMCSVSLFPGGSHVLALLIIIPTSMQNRRVYYTSCLSQSARKICKFVFGSCNEVDVISPPSDCNGRSLQMEPSNAFVLVCSKKRSALETITLANSDSYLKPFKGALYRI